MPYSVARVELRDFRNYRHETIEVDPRTTVLVGPNGVGKTNAIEAVQLLLTGESFRRAAWPELVRWGQPQAVAAAVLSEDSRESRITLEIEVSGPRVLRIGGHRKRRLGAGRDLLPCVTFTPDDLQVVKGPAENRRAALDSVGDGLSKTFTALRQEYERLVRQRNKALKEGADDALVDVLGSAMSEAGAKLVVHRIRLLRRLAAAAGIAYAAVARGQRLEARYVMPWVSGEAPEEETAVAEAMERALRTRATEERARGVTLVGPHRDDVAFLIDERDARAFGSQGQQRTVALAWKLAEVEVVEAVSGKAPVLLLDDVMSELDESRRHALASFVGERVQTIATTANLDYFEPAMLARATVRTLG